MTLGGCLPDGIFLCIHTGRGLATHPECFNRGVIGLSKLGAAFPRPGSLSLNRCSRKRLGLKSRMDCRNGDHQSRVDRTRAPWPLGAHHRPDLIRQPASVPSHGSRVAGGRGIPSLRNHCTVGDGLLTECGGEATNYHIYSLLSFPFSLQATPWAASSGFCHHHLPTHPQVADCASRCIEKLTCGSCNRKWPGCAMTPSPSRCWGGLATWRIN